ncbi:tetratricopeptide repeat protein [Sedimentitalea arenosa]|jgi:hypothetical protein|uniref:Ancillary SecYEG translocon subunit/Cell division coordinator CpoB TPR domain-containing protein n=1 Tax=Sedimentitalea arenosa TaxID=2798803 RepID=A0A8J7J5T9_9RHOB|nr:tetratricopeptide repeat protein [Arenibacterium arenosum]MBJ6370672.1 hypothetical protein [Arenibacterium arenosum]
MSDTDSFIDEVTEEVRRDRLFLLFKRYAWIAAALIILIVGGAAWNEYRKAQARAEAEQLGDSIIAALAANDAAARANALTDIEVDSPGGAAIVNFLTAATSAESGQTEDAVAALNEIATTGELPEIYRQIATFKALTLQAETLPAADRRVQFEALAQPGAPLRLLAQEQLALIDISEGDTDAALDKLQAILQDAEVGPGLQQRATRVIVALGGTPQPQPGSQG